jgi:hypothetical protein
VLKVYIQERILSASGFALNSFDARLLVREIFPAYYQSFHSLKEMYGEILGVLFSMVDWIWTKGRTAPGFKNFQ